MSSFDQQDSVESDQENLDKTILERTHQDVGEDIHVGLAALLITDQLFCYVTFFR